MALIFPLATGAPVSHHIDKEAYRYTVDAAGLFKALRDGYERMDGYPGLQVEYMSIVVGGLIRMVNLIGSMRSAVRLGQRGLAQFDADLAGFQARTRVYASQFERDGQGEPLAFATGEMTADDWDDYRNTLEGPVLYWNRKEWLESGWWSNPIDGPPGFRPDGLEQWMLWNQVSAIRTTQQQLVQSFWGYVHFRASEFAEATSGAARELWRGVADTAEEAASSAWEAIRDNLVPSSTAGKLGAAVVIGGLVAGGAYLWFSPRRA